MKAFRMGARIAAVFVVACGMIYLGRGILFERAVSAAPALYTVTSYSPIEETAHGRFGEIRIQTNGDDAWYVNDDLKLLHMSDAQLHALRLHMKIVCQKTYRVRTLTGTRVAGSDEYRCYIPSKRMLYARASARAFFYRTSQPCAETAAFTLSMRSLTSPSVRVLSND